MIIFHLSVTLYITLTGLSSLTVASSGLGCSHPRDPYSPALQVDLKKNRAYGNDANIIWVDHLKAKRGVCATQGGDSGTTPNAAEVHGLGRDFLIYSNVLTGYKDYTTNGHLTVEHKAKAISDHLTIYISHERVEVTNHRGYQAVYDSKYLFVLDGQPIGSSPFSFRNPKVETDIWLSMNRVISGAYRSGTGLCRVAISWV